MDLSKILSHYDDDDNNNNGHEGDDATHVYSHYQQQQHHRHRHADDHHDGDRHYYHHQQQQQQHPQHHHRHLQHQTHAQQQHVMPPLHHSHQHQHQHRADGYSAAEMQCAVAILTDFHQPDADAPAATPPRSSRHARSLLHDERKTDDADGATAMDVDATTASSSSNNSNSYRTRQQQHHHHHHSDGDAADDNDDDDDAKSHASDAATGSGGWASGTDLMSKLDLLVQADEMIQSSSSQPASVAASPAFVRSGVWTRAEEEYAAALIYYFLKGLLPLKEGTTLRKFLAEKLCCNRRRVSMKLATESIALKRIPRKVGASVFVAAADAAAARAHVDETLASLRAQCFDPAASPALESRPPRPSKLTDELPDLLLSEPTPVPQYATAAPSHWLGPATSPPPSSSLSSGPAAASRSERTADTAAAVTAAATTTSDAPVKRELETTPKKLKSKALGVRAVAPELLRSPPGTGNVKRRKPTIIRTGFETVEEEAYVTAMVEYFLAGALDLADGTKLVSYLCDELGCSAKTLSMKLAPRRLGERKFPDNVGSITYMRKPMAAADAAHIDTALANLRTACFDYANATPLPAARSASASVKRERKHSNASTTSASSAASPSRSLAFSRSGAWSREEELYAAALIDCFFKGTLELVEGTTLRAFLAARLSCNPMRVSKKLASEWIADIKIPKKLGSSTFVKRAGVPAHEQEAAEAALRSLEDAYVHAESLKDESASSSSGVGAKHARPEEPQDGEQGESGDDASEHEAVAGARSSEDDAGSSSSDDDADDDADGNGDGHEDDARASSGEPSPKKPRTARAQSPSPSPHKQLEHARRRKALASGFATDSAPTSPACAPAMAY